MKPFAIFAIMLAASLAFIPRSDAYSAGAGSCIAGTGVLGAPHGKPTNTKVTNGTLATGGFSVLIDGTALRVGVVRTVSIKKVHTLSVKAGTSKSFRGFNVRLGIASSTALKPLKTDTSVAKTNTFCASARAVGITQRSNAVKTIANGNLTVSTTAANVPLEVVVVVQNRNKLSIWYYSKFTLKFA